MSQKQKKEIFLDFRKAMNNYERKYAAVVHDVYEKIWEIVNRGSEIDVNVFDETFKELHHDSKDIIAAFTTDLLANFGHEADMAEMAAFYEGALAQSPALMLMEDVHKIENWQGLKDIPKEYIDKMFKKATAKEEQDDDGSVNLGGVRYEFLDMVFFDNTEYLAVQRDDEVKIACCVPDEKGNGQIYVVVENAVVLNAVNEILASRNI